MIAIQDHYIVFSRQSRLTPDYCLPLLRLERCPFCGEEIVRAWFSLPEDVGHISPVRYEGLPAREDYKSAFRVVCTPGYGGLVRRFPLYWHASNQVICKQAHVFSSPSRSANLRELFGRLHDSFPTGDERDRLTELAQGLSDTQWNYLADEVLPQYLGVPFTWGEIRAPVEELSGEIPPTLVFQEKLYDTPEGEDASEWRDTVRAETGRFVREFLAPALQLGRGRRGERYAQLRPWRQGLGI